MLRRKQWWVVSMTAVLWQQILVGRECVPCMGLQIWFIRVSKICHVCIHVYIYIIYIYIKSAVLAELPSWIQSVGRSSQQGIAGGVEVMFGNLEKSYSWNEIPPSTMRVLARVLNSETWRNTWQPRLQLEKRRNPFRSWNVAGRSLCCLKILSTCPQGPQFPLVPTSSMGWRQVALGTVWGDQTESVTH